jgi:[acyl-carrier-protein] S-malonyltransferase
MSYAVLCPGQGAQHAGMLDLLHENSAAAEILAIARDVLHADLHDWLRDGEIFDNHVAQPLICMSQLAAWRALHERVPLPSYFAGYSVGELASYGCADALDARELARLARRRADLMQAALGDTGGGLVAIRGLPRAATDRLCEAFEAWTAIALGDASVVIGATPTVIDDVAAAAREQGGEIRCLKVGVPAHTPMLQGAVAPFREALEQSRLSAPGIPVLAGIDAAPVVDRPRAIETLSNQVAHTIEWAHCMDTLHERGCRIFLELGPGAALSRMLRERFADVDARSLDDFRSLAGCVRWLESRLPSSDRSAF